MKAVQFEAKSNLVDEFMVWLYQHSKNEFKLNYIQDVDNNHNKSAIQYMDDKEQQEMEHILKNRTKDDKEVSHTKTIYADV